MNACKKVAATWSRHGRGGRGKWGGGKVASAGGAKVFLSQLGLRLFAVVKKDKLEEKHSESTWTQVVRFCV